MRKALTTEMILFLSLALVVFSLFISILPGPAESIKESLSLLFGINKQYAEQTETTLKLEENEKIVWVVGEYYLPYFTNALAQLSYELAYELGIIDYSRYNSLASRIPVLQQTTQAICCEIRKKDCKIFVSSTREFCNAFGGRVHELSCDIYIKLSIPKVGEAYIVLDSPIAKKCGNNYYLVPESYVSFVDPQCTPVTLSVVETREKEISMPSFYCTINSAPADKLRVLSARAYTTIYKVLTYSKSVACPEKLPLEC